jgi:hypothetical protein
LGGSQGLIGFGQLSAGNFQCRFYSGQALVSLSEFLLARFMAFNPLAQGILGGI